jgi:hypothetical protein
MGGLVITNQQRRKEGIVYFGQRKTASIMLAVS